MKKEKKEKKAKKKSERPDFIYEIMKQVKLNLINVADTVPGTYHRLASTILLLTCHSTNDGECYSDNCPQLADGEPERSGRHCPLDNWDDE